MIYVMRTGEKVKVLNTYAYMGSDGKAVVMNNLKVISGIKYVPDGESEPVFIYEGMEYSLTQNELQNNGSLLQ